MPVLGDLDDDGCDDLAVGAPREDQGVFEQVVEGYDVDGVPTLLVGAPLSDQRTLDGGAAYILRFPAA